jgi:hypothetical protein
MNGNDYHVDVCEDGIVRLGTLVALTQVPAPSLNVDFHEVIAIKLCDVGLPPLSRLNNQSINRVKML